MVILWLLALEQDIHVSKYNKKTIRKMVFVHVLGYETIDHIVQAHIGIHPLFLLDTRPVWKFCLLSASWICYLALSTSISLIMLGLNSQSHYFEVVFVCNRYSMIFHECLFVKWVWKSCMFFIWVLKSIKNVWESQKYVINMTF